MEQDQLEFVFSEENVFDDFLGYKFQRIIDCLIFDLIIVFKLWQIYFECVNLFFKIVYVFIV